MVAISTLRSLIFESNLKLSKNATKHPAKPLKGKSDVSWPNRGIIHMGLKWCWKPEKWGA